jgi:hypothetical protein
MSRASVFTMTRGSQRPDPRRSPTPYGVTARITTAQYVALLALAEHRDIPLSGALRVMIDFWVEHHISPEDRAALESGTIASIQPEADWQERHGTARPPA